MNHCRKTKSAHNMKSWDAPSSKTLPELCHANLSAGTWEWPERATFALTATSNLFSDAGLRDLAILRIWDLGRVRKAWPTLAKLDRV
jgi:hypothetical protein